MNPWFKRNPHLLEDIKKSLQDEYSDLWVNDHEQHVDVIGSFSVRANNKIVDRFRVRIELPNNYPKIIPVVFEVGGRIPYAKERHINENDVPEYGTKKGSACLFLPEEQFKYYPEGTSFIEFLNGPVNDFFLWQVEYELTGVPSVKGMEHGAKGIVEYYAQEIGIKDLNTIVQFTDYLSKDAKGHWDCFCGSGKKLRDCHYSILIESRRNIAKKIALRSHKSLLAYRSGRVNSNI